MDSLFQDRNGEANEHPQRELLLLFVDGELATKEASQLESHLEACWPCRVRTQRIQATIADIIEFDETVLTSRLLPPHDWRNFDRQLNQLAAVSGDQSLLARLMAAMGRFSPVARLVSGNNRNHSVATTDKPFITNLFVITPVRATVTVMLIGLIIALALFSKHEAVVTATELLSNAAEAEATRVRATTQPVIHQRLQLRRKTSAHEETVNWETWHDTANSRFIRICDGCRTSSAVPQITRGIRAPTPEALITELNTVLASNRMDHQRPMSATSFQSWHATLQHPQDEVTRTKLRDGTEALSLRTVVSRPISEGAISETVFVVRARDWQPAELRLTVADANGARVYELTASVSEVVSLPQVDPKLFATFELETRNPKLQTESSELETPNSKLETGAPAAAASADLEVEVLRLLHEARADLGEQITVSRGADGLLQVNGIVETSARKAEIMRALQPVTSHAAVRIQIQTVAEAVAEQQRQAIRSKATPGPVTEQKVEINSEAAPAAPELRRHFQSDEQMRQFAARMVSRSRNALRHVYALKRMLGQFSAEELRTLSPDARNKWLGLIRSHARAYRIEAEALRGELQPIFFPSASGSVGPGPDITDEASLVRAVEQLFSVALANDGVIRSAFATSSESFSASAINSARFWQSLKQSEALAAGISRQ